MSSKAKAAVLDPVTPGELLWEEFLVPMGLSRYRLAKEIGSPRSGSATSSAGSGPLRLTLTYGCAGSSARRTAIGFAPRQPTTAWSHGCRWRTS
jgi:hypothetical protein